jgi:hypothetical protein
MFRMLIDVHVARPRREVLAWWTRFPDDYRARDPREQPHRIKVVDRRDDRVELLTFWRLPLGIELVIPETMRPRPDGDFVIDVHFPLGLDQRDVFTFREENGATHVSIDIRLAARNVLGRLTRPLYWHLYGRRTYPRTFRMAGVLCERDAPRLEEDQAQAGR